jgi:molybdopterin converting factor small subunit
MTSRPSAPTRTSVHVTVRYWASARAVAGCDSERLGVHVGRVHVGRVNVGDVLAAAAAAHTGLSVVLDVSSILLDGRAVTAAEPLTEGAILEVLPPFAGG